MIEVAQGFSAVVCGEGPGCCLGTCPCPNPLRLISARHPCQFACRVQEGQEPNQFIQTQASTPDWFRSLHSVHQPWLPRSGDGGEPTHSQEQETSCLRDDF